MWHGNIVSRKEIGLKAEVNKEHPVEKTACGMEILFLVKK